MNVEICPLYRRPDLTRDVAQMIYNEFWVGVDGGLTLEFLDDHLRCTHDPDRIPLSWIALVDGELAGTINLIENDDAKRAHLRPWLAALVVAQPHRGRGVGSKLVRTLLDDARRLAIATVYFGTDGPGFYERLGALRHEHVKDDFWIMRFELA